VKTKEYTGRDEISVGKRPNDFLTRGWSAGMFCTYFMLKHKVFQLIYDMAMTL